MKKKVSISVVVPVYNSEKFIGNCLNSILIQTYTNYEIICVNDGSTDKSKKKILKYIDKYPDKIRIIDQKNQGSGAARNTGIDNARGEYIIFIDSDDDIHPQMFEKLYNNVTKYNADIAVCGLQRIDETTNKVLSNDMVSHNYTYLDLNEENIEKFLFINPGPCNKIHKKIIFKNARFAEIPVVDDLMLMLKYFINIKRISFVPEVLYYYKYRRNSSSNSLSYDTFCDLKKYMIDMKKNYMKKKVPSYYIDFIDKIAFIHIGISMLTKLSYRKDINMRKEIKLTKRYLDDNFISWRDISFKKSFKDGNSRFIGLYILKIFYKTNLFIVFIRTYRYLNDVLKKDIKW